MNETIVLECCECGEPFEADVTEGYAPRWWGSYLLELVAVRRSCACSKEDAGESEDRIFGTVCDRARDRSER